MVKPLFNRPWPVPFCVHDAEKAEGLPIGVFQLVWPPGAISSTLSGILPLCPCPNERFVRAHIGLGHLLDADIVETV